MIFSDHNSLLFKNENSAASTSIISKYFNEISPSPQQNFFQNNSKMNSNQLQTAAIMSDSESSIYSIEKQKQQKTSQRASAAKQTFHSKSNSQTSGRSKSRNGNNASLSLTQDAVIAENALIQEGVNVLFSKSKKKRMGNISPSPFKSLGKPPMKAQEKEIIQLKKVSKSKKPTKKTKSKSTQRSKTINMDTQKPTTNIILPNVQKLEQLNRRSFELENNQLSLTSSNQDFEKSSQSKKPPLQKILTQSEHNNKIIQQGRSLQMIVSFLKHLTKDKKRICFEKWRFQSLAQRSSVQILAQTRWINEIQTIRSESQQELIQMNREVVLRKGIACIFRFKSRRLARMFAQWKFKIQFINYMQSYLNYKKTGDNKGDTSFRSSFNKQPDSMQYQRLIKSHINRPSINEYNDDLENIDDSEDSAEKVISKQKKIGLIINKTVGRQSNKDYNFTNPSADLEQLPYQLEIFKQILQSPNKDFGRLMMQSSECSIQYFNDNIVNDATSSRRVSLERRPHNLTGGQHQSQQMLQVQYFKASLVIKQKLEGQLREVFSIWRRDTDRYLQSLEFKMKQREINVKKHVAIKLSNLKVINSQSLLRHTQVAFNSWKLQTVIEKKAENKKLQMYFLNNAKVEVQRSKAVLQKLYQQKQMFDEEQKVFRSRSTSPEAAQYLPNQNNFSNNSNYKSNQGLTQQHYTNSQNSPHMQRQPQGFSSSSIMQLMNPYFMRNQHALPQKLQSIVNHKNNQQEVVSQIKSLCYDMLLDILEEAEKNSKPPNSS